jgi:LmbE family N-acetylglucosaminyl deacetylase
MRHLFPLVLAGAVACLPAATPPRATARVAQERAGSSPASAAASWLILSPHPDDAVLIAGGVIARAVAAGERVAIAVLTNGDYACVTDGLVREREDVAGFRDLAVPESDVYFLGYPDGALGALGRAPLRRERLERDGRCAPEDATYAAYGNGGAEWHRARTGAPAPYTRANAVGDLASLLERVRPTDVVLTHPDDVHPDHAATYALFRAALDRVAFAPRVHRAIVHDGDCWPTGPEPSEPCPPAALRPGEPTPPLTGRLAGYTPRERLAVPAALLDPNPSTNPKMRAIAAHSSQTRGTYASYLFAFSRSDETFFPETFERIGARWLRTGTVPREAMITTEVKVRRARVEIAMSLPLAIDVRLARGATRLDFFEDASGGYALEIDAARGEARWLRRVAGRATPAVLAAWPLPDDLWAESAEEPFALRVDPRPDDGGVAELALSLRGELWGEAVDVRPRIAGGGLRVTSEATEPSRAEDGIDVRVSVAPPLVRAAR